MNLTNADTGAIGGLDADGGPVRTAQAIVDDSSDRNPNAPPAGFKVRKQAQFAARTVGSAQ